MANSINLNSAGNAFTMQRPDSAGRATTPGATNLHQPAPGGVLLPDYLLNPPGGDISDRFFKELELRNEPQYQGRGDRIEWLVQSSGKRILLRGVTNHRTEPQVMGWMRGGIGMARKSIALLNANDRNVDHVLQKYFHDSSPKAKQIFLYYAQKAAVTLQQHVEQRGAQVVPYSGDNYGAFVYPTDNHQRIFINQRGFNAGKDDPFMARLMVHEATHFAGAGDHGYISHVGINRPTNKLNNADSLAYAMQELARYHRGDIESKPLLQKPQAPVQPAHGRYRLWHNPLGGEREVEVWDQKKNDSGGYKNGDFVVDKDGRGLQLWQVPGSNKMGWIEALDPKRSYHPGELASRYGKIVQPNPHYRRDQLWHNPLGGERLVEVWNHTKNILGGYKNGDFVVYHGRGFQLWQAPGSNKLEWVEALDPKRIYRPGEWASRYGKILQPNPTRENRAVPVPMQQQLERDTRPPNPGGQIAPMPAWNIKKQYKRDEVIWHNNQPYRAAITLVQGIAPQSGRDSIYWKRVAPNAISQPRAVEAATIGKLLQTQSWPQ